MTERSEHIAQLIIKEVNGLLTEEEAVQLRVWRMASLKHEAVYSELTEPQMMAEQLRIVNSYDNSAMERRMQAEFVELGVDAARSSSPASTAPSIPFYKAIWLRYAAILLLVVISGVYLFLSYSSYFNVPKEVAQQMANSDQHPASNRAILTLADGAQIALDSAVNGVLAEQSSTQVIKLSDGQISYKQKTIAAGSVGSNTISTPRGGHYKLTLPDGSNVYLNAASSITYPVSFTGKERRVAVKGEVYVEVVKNPQMPFMVEVDGKSVIEVLGTSFNIHAYPEEKNQYTTLLNGSVKVSLLEGNNKHNQRGSSIVLKPGEAAQVSEEISLEKPNIEQVLAWRNGIFNFSGKSFESFMREIARWYDVDVVYEGTPPTFGMSGEMDRNVKLSEIIQLLKNYNIEVCKQGKTLIIR